MNEWDHEHAMAASKEGWDIFACTDSEHPDWELQVLDDWDDEDQGVRPFEADDFAAGAWVVKRAQEGSGLHADALYFLKVNSPEEHWHICTGISYTDVPLGQELLEEEIPAVPPVITRDVIVATFQEIVKETS